MEIVFLIVSFFASVAGAICGIGGGVITKPILDLTGLASVSAVSFLSGCAVLTMSAYSIGKNIWTKSNIVDLYIGTWLAIGAAIGGIAGKHMFTIIGQLFENPETVGKVQAFSLGIITIGTLIYSIKKSSIKSYDVKNGWHCLLIGLVLGVVSSFLGIGGGPINLVVLYFFFSMDTKTAAQNSLYVILFSQITAVFTSVFTNTVPKFPWSVLFLMVLGGIAGGVVGRYFYRKMDNDAVEKLFIVLMGIIIAICMVNFIK